MASLALRTAAVLGRRVVSTGITARPAFRSFATCQVRLSSALVTALQKELKESEGLPKPAPPLPGGFTMVDRDGYNLVMLKGTFGPDQVVVQFSVPPRLEFDLPVNELQLNFDVLIKKPQRGVIEVRCKTCDQGYDIESVAFFEEKDKKIAEEETAEADYQRDLRYGGPHLDDLEEDLQTSLGEFLQEKGITVELARFIQAFIKETKEPKEYARWVAGLLKFVQ
eukprot:RCo044732